MAKSKLTSIFKYRSINNSGFRREVNSFLVVGLMLFLTTACQQEKDERTLDFPTQIELIEDMPDKDHFWIFILAGQSNMAGRGLVEPIDTIANKRILSINENNQWIYAKEPLHFYEPTLTGLDCGTSFANTLLNEIPADIMVGILPCAIGGSSVEQWLGDSLYRGVHLFSNFREKVDLAKESGTIRGILWHQGESNAKTELIPSYQDKLMTLFSSFRNYIQNDSLPIIAGQLGSYTQPSEQQMRWDSINRIIRNIGTIDRFTAVIDTKDLTEKGDKIHFDSKSQRMMGVRFAKEMLMKVNKN
jgi:hypothetical protein